MFDEVRADKFGLDLLSLVPSIKIGSIDGGEQRVPAEGLFVIVSIAFTVAGAV